MLTLRFSETTEHDTRGEIDLDGAYYCHILTTKPPRIPDGDYVLNVYTEGKHPFPVLRFERQDDPSFALHEFEIHPLNVYLETKGCIGVGTGYGDIDFSASNNPIKREWGIVNGILESPVTFEKLMRDVPGGTPITVVTEIPSVPA